MLKRLQNLAKREASGALSGKQLSVGDRSVKVDRLLGEGGFATIYRCTDVETGDVYALKHFLLTGYPDAARDAATEVGIMEALQGCPHVVRLREAAFSGPPGAETAALLLMDYCPDTLVAHLQQRAFRISTHELLAIFLPVCRAVAAMHSLRPPLAHRDVKAENVLLGPDGRWLLCDFGSASGWHGVLESARDIAMEEEVVRKYTTPAYRAPELYDLYAREYLGPPVDVWALGVLLYLLAYGRLPFEGEAKLQVLNGRVPAPPEAEAAGRPPQLASLVRDMLTVSPRQRPTIRQVLVRLREMAPPELWQEGQGHGVQQAGSGAPPLHERVPSQGWADFASEGSGAASLGRMGSGGGSDAGHGSFTRRLSGSGSWATFSPTKGGEGVGPAAGAATAAAGVGSFWSSFGEEAPLTDAQPADAHPAGAPEEQQQAQQQQWQQHEEPQAQAGAQRPPVPAPQLLPVAARQQAAPPAAAAAAAPLVEPADISPLSAGLARMSQPAFTVVGSSAATLPAHPAAASPAAPFTGESAAGAGPRPRPPQEGQAPAAAAGLAGADVAGEAAELRQHCVVLEQLLDARNGEIRRLHQLGEQQAAQLLQQGTEIQQLRQQLEAAAQKAPQQQQEQRQLGSSAAAAATPSPAPAAAASASATPGSSRLGQDRQLEVPGSDSSWVSFNAASSRELRDAPTPTLLQPAAEGSFKGSSASNNSTSSRPVAAQAQGRPGAAAHSGSGTPLEEAMRYKLDLGMGPTGSSSSGSGGSSGRTAGAEQQRQPMQTNSSKAAAAAAQASSSVTQQQLRSYPVQLTPPPFALDGPRSAPASAKPSPVRTSSTAAGLAASGSRSPMQPGSPMVSRPGSGLSGASSGGGQGSPSKHRRHGTAPHNAVFDDLNPLQ